MKSKKNLDRQDKEMMKLYCNSIKNSNKENSKSKKEGFNSSNKRKNMLKK